ncbi:MAG: lipopolysaccharide biosynthesis protein, partial [Saprospiraceae bacterium]
MSLVKKLAGETAIYGISSILSRLLNYVLLTPFFTRVFFKGEYGAISILFTVSAFLMILFTYRMETAFFRFGNQKEDLNKTFSTASISLLTSTLVFLLLGHLASTEISNLLTFPDHPEYFILLLWLIAFDALSAIPFARLRLENRPFKFAFIKTLNIVINIIAAYFFLSWLPYLIDRGFSQLSFLYDADNRIIYVFISQLIASIITFLYLVPLYFKMQWQFDTELWKRMFWYAMPLIIVGIAAVINSLIAIPLLKIYLPETLEKNQEVAGLYGATAKLAILMNLFTQAFNYAAEPFFFRNADREDSKQIYADVGQAFALVGSIVFLGIMLYLDVIKFFLGKDFQTGLEIVPILLLANFCLGLYYNFSIWYKLTDRTKIGGYISLGGVAITLAINIIFIPIIQYPAPAWSALTCYGFMAAMSLKKKKKYYPVPYPIQRMLSYILIAVGVFSLNTLLLEMLQLEQLLSIT